MRGKPRRVYAGTLHFPSAPAGGFTFEQSVGYRVVVTPTTLGQDVTVRVKADAVMGEGTTKTNRASNIFRRKTAS